MTSSLSLTSLFAWQPFNLTQHSMFLSMTWHSMFLSITWHSMFSLSSPAPALPPVRNCPPPPTSGRNTSKLECLQPSPWLNLVTNRPQFQSVHLTQVNVRLVGQLWMKFKSFQFWSNLRVSVEQLNPVFGLLGRFLYISIFYNCWEMLRFIQIFIWCFYIFTNLSQRERFDLDISLKKFYQSPFSKNIIFLFTFLKYFYNFYF